LLRAGPAQKSRIVLFLVCSTGFVLAVSSFRGFHILLRPLIGCRTGRGCRSAFCNGASAARSPRPNRVHTLDRDALRDVVRDRRPRYAVLVRDSTGTSRAGRSLSISEERQGNVARRRCLHRSEMSLLMRRSASAGAKRKFSVLASRRTVWSAAHRAADL
jgi:hypothetical protein